MSILRKIQFFLKGIVVIGKPGRGKNISIISAYWLERISSNPESSASELAQFPPDQVKGVLQPISSALPAGFIKMIENHRSQQQTP